MSVSLENQRLEDQVTERLSPQIKEVNGFVKFINSSRIGGFCDTAAATVYTSKLFWEIDPDACTYILKHEIGHINGRHFDLELLPKIIITAEIAGICTAGTLSYMALLPAWQIATVALATFIAFEAVNETVYSRIREYRADTFALTNSSDEELKGGVRLWKARILVQERLNLSLLDKFDSVLDSGLSTHPSRSSRLRRVEGELKKRGCSLILNSEDLKKMKDLYTCELWDRHEIKSPEYDDFATRHRILMDLVE